MITFTTAERGEVDINPSFVTAVCQPTSASEVPQPTFISLVGGLTYSVPLSIAEVRNKLATEYTDTAYLCDIIERFTEMIRNR